MILASLGPLATLDVTTELQGGQQRIRAATLTCSIPVRVQLTAGAAVMLDQVFQPGVYNTPIGGNISVETPAFKVYLGSA